MADVAVAETRGVPVNPDLERVNLLWKQVPKDIRSPLVQAMDMARGAFDFVNPRQGNRNEQMEYEKEFDETFNGKLSTYSKREFAAGNIPTASIIDPKSPFYSLTDPESPTSQLVKYCKENPKDEDFMNMLFSKEYSNEEAA